MKLMCPRLDAVDGVDVSTVKSMMMFGCGEDDDDDDDDVTVA